MRTLGLMIAFAVGGTFLLPRPVLSLDDCKGCTCKQMKAWQELEKGNIYGLRAPDPNDPTTTIPVEHVPALVPVGGPRLLALAEDEGARTAKTNIYSIFQYTKTPDLDCKVAANENGYSKVRVTFAKMEDWDYFKTTDLAKQEQHLCVKGDIEQPE